MFHRGAQHSCSFGCRLDCVEPHKLSWLMLGKPLRDVQCHGSSSAPL